MAYVIPMMSSAPGRGPLVLIVILTRDNLERMREGDPFDMHLSAYQNQLDLAMPLENLDLVIAYEEDAALLESIAKRGDMTALLTYIERGREHRPGDAEPPKLAARVRRGK